MRATIALLCLLQCCPLLEASPEPLASFVEEAGRKHGEIGQRAARFLIAHMPEADRKQLAPAWLFENLDLAFQARATFPWAKDLSEELFFNDVLPYAVLDEPRDPWRADFLAKATPIVQGAKSAGEAAQLLNRDFFKLINTHYHTGRKRTNQSPKESIEQGKATCTGLSIILVDACRAVGIAARAAGIPMWPDRSGNHTWVEIHDQGQWHYLGADEYDARGLNHAWFTEAAAKADPDQPLHSIYATSWKPQGLHFPLVWAPQNTQVGGVNVTERYLRKTQPAHQLGVRLFAGNDRSSRIAASGWLTSSQGDLLQDFTTRAGTSDLNDMPMLAVEPGQSYRLRISHEGQQLETPPFVASAGSTTKDLLLGDLQAVVAEKLPEGPLTREQAAAATRTIHQELVAAQTADRRKELDGKSITLGDHTLKWLEKTFGETPKNGRSLWISMHGGGEAPQQVNDQQWQNQIRLYQPAEGIYLAPRAPTNTWNMWHQGHIDPLFSRLIESMVALRGVNPDKVYLMGYSAGGDGVWQVAPRMADRFAAASMMAGHPNEAQLFGLRNLPFGIFCGAEDIGVKRNEVCTRKVAEIEALHKADPGGYVNMTRIYPGMAHWMKLKDAESVPWMAGFTRQTWPKKIVWYQDDVTHDRFYWLELPPGKAVKDQRIEAEIKGQRISLKGDVPAGIRLLLHDALLDLDQPVEISINGGAPKTHKPRRSAAVIREALEKRLDSAAAPSACIVVE